MQPQQTQASTRSVRLGNSFFQRMPGGVVGHFREAHISMGYTDLSLGALHRPGDLAGVRGD